MQTSQNDRFDYRHLLLGELELRKRKNKSFSLRAFANHLQVSPAYLSQIFSHKRNLSEETGLQMAKKLRWPAQKRKLFCSLIKYQRAEGPDAKAEALSEVQDFSELDFIELQNDQFQLIAEWFHFAIVELTDTKGFQSDPRWIARRLGITPQQAEEAIDRLVRVGILDRKAEKLTKPKAHYRIGDVPSEAIRAFHNHNLKAAQTALARQNFQTRDFSGTTVAVDLERLPEIKELIRDFRKRLSNFCSQSPQPQAVYQLSVQFFRLDREMK